MHYWSLRDKNILHVRETKLDIFKSITTPAFSSFANFLNKDIDLLINDLSVELNDIKNIYTACLSEASSQF